MFLGSSTLLAISMTIHREALYVVELHRPTLCRIICFICPVASWRQDVYSLLM